MSRIRYLADHDLKEAILTGLLRLDPTIYIVRAREAGLERASDSEVLACAAQEGFIMISHDLRTMPAHAHARLRAGLPMAGLFMIRQTDPIGPSIEDLFLIWSASEAEEWRGQVIYLPF